MKIETDDNTFFATVIAVFLIGLFCLGGYGCNQMEQTKRDAIDAGLVEVQGEGTTMTRWAKPQ